MLHRLFSVAGVTCASLFLLTAVTGQLAPSALAQSNNSKPAEKTAPAAPNASKDTEKANEYAEVQHALSGPVGNPECVWLGRRVVSLLWRDDLDTAFRHLDLYDRFGCPSAHIQAAFRCLILHGNNIDPKAADTLNGRVLACWINPTDPAIPANPAPAATASTPPASSH
jgi:hypothetical protein